MGLAAERWRCGLAASLGIDVGAGRSGDEWTRRLGRGKPQAGLYGVMGSLRKTGDWAAREQRSGLDRWCGLSTVGTGFGFATAGWDFVIAGYG
jgi:hypothetical protein